MNTKMTAHNNTHTFWMLVCVVMAIVGFVVHTGVTHAFTVENLDVAITNDFVLRPSKSELSLNPGETTTRDITVTNRTNRTITFSIVVEDFVGSHNEEDTVILLGNEESPYSLKDYIVPEVTSFTLLSGQRITLPITVSVPEGTAGTGLYGAVIISNDASPNDDTNTESKTRLVSRLGSLFFVKVGGTADENGSFEDFRVSGPKKLLHENGEFTFEILFKNNGNIHLVPHGVILIKNMFGMIIATLPIDPYFALPDATRFRSISWDGGSLFGRYSITALLSRGYGDIVDERTFSVWVFPWKLTLIGLLLIAILGTLIRLIQGKFEIRRKT